jgi:hypothetical protein
LGLHAPHKQFAQKAKLKIIQLHPSKLFRISRRNTGEPYFGKQTANRFNDPRVIPIANRFGACYFGTSIACAFGETVLHDETMDLAIGGYRVAYAEVETRYVLKFDGDPLNLAVMHGDALFNVGGNSAISSERPYKTTRKWSLAVHQHPANVDGFVYLSRHSSDREAVVLFDRAAPKIQVKPPIHKFVDEPMFSQVIKECRVSFSY